MKLLVLLDHYLPGFRAGGPPRSLANVVERLGHRIEFWIFTRNHDFADTTPYQEVQTNKWNDVGRAHVYYCSPDRLSAGTIRRTITEVAPQVIYLNSFFSSLTIKCLLLRRLGLVPRLPCILAPRGEFSPKALRLKRAKKLPYRLLARIAGLYRGVIWQASSTHERDDIVRTMGPQCRIFIATNMPKQLASLRRSIQRRKIAGQARFVFVSRISPMKNLQFALQLLCDLEGEIVFDIYGPKETSAYWETCQSIMRTLPQTVRASYCGSLAPSDVVDVVSGYHFFLLPTLGENFGHVIFEALNAGCPVVISDRTMWRGLAAKHAGWDLPLENRTAWANVLRQCVEMDEVAFQAHSRAATRLAEAVSSDHTTEEQNLSLFTSALANA